MPCGVSKQCVVMSWLNGSKGGQKAAALAEVAWSAPESLSGYQDFLSRLTGAMIPFYTSAGWPFAKYYEEDLK